MKNKILVCFLFLLAGVTTFAQKNKKRGDESLILSNKIFRASAFVPYLKLDAVSALANKHDFSTNKNLGFNIGLIGSFDAPHSRPNYNFELFVRHLIFNDEQIGVESLTSVHLSQNLDIKLSKYRKRVYPLLRIGGEMSMLTAFNRFWIIEERNLNYAWLVGLGVHIFPRSYVRSNRNFDSSSKLEYKILLLYTDYTDPLVFKIGYSKVITLQLNVKNVFKNRYK